MKEFISRFPRGTREYLALQLMLGLLARRSDVVHLDPANMIDGKIRFTARKTSVEVIIPIGEDLHEALRLCPPDGSHFLLTMKGELFSEVSFGD